VLLLAPIFLRETTTSSTNTRRPAGTEGRYDLHSQVLPRLVPELSTADDVMRAIKRAQNLHDAHDLLAIERFLLEQTDEHFAYGFRGSLLSRLAVAALHMDNHRLARLALEERRRHHPVTPGSELSLSMESAAIIRGLLRVHNVTDAQAILDEELPLPPATADLTQPAVRELLKHRASALASFASRHFFEGEPSMAVLSCRQLAQMAPVLEQARMSAEELDMPWERLLKGAAQCEAGRRDGSVPRACGNVTVPNMPCNVVYAVLDAMVAFPTMNSDRAYELLSNALVRRVVFVTGALDMASCPPADRGEAAFIGRSNVNMVTNCKSLAYTSKRPGKTQQFNFFAVNDKVGREKEIKYGDVVVGEKDDDAFYLVDLPSFGYAQVPEAQRKQWKEFMHEYIAHRPTLRVVFHLMDARHGPTGEDAGIMQQVTSDLPPHVKYVIVLTKADKNVKGASNSITNAGKVPSAVMDLLLKTMRENGAENVPILVSSAETK